MGIVALAAVVMLGQLLPGLWLASRTAERLHLGAAAFAFLTPLLGLVFVGVATLLAGHLALIGPWLPWGGAVVGAVAVGLDRSRVGRSLRAVAKRVQTQWLSAPISVSAVAVGLGVATVASFAPPSRVDEVEYHWAAPLEWAGEGRWIDSSYRHVDSFPLMEIAYTFAATLDSYAGAHLMHLSTLVALGFAASLAAGAVGVRATGAVGAAAIAMPVMWDQAYVAYNDTAVGGFSVAAAALALRGRWGRGELALISVLLVAAISIKPTAVGAAGVVGLIVLIRVVRAGRWDREALSGVLRIWTPLALVSVATLGFWTLRRFALTGTWIDPSLTSPASADELTRLPSTLDQALAPVMPLVLPLTGATEPWGGRIGLALMLLAPALIFVLWQRGRVLGRFTEVVVPAWVHWVVVGFAVVRTRFHLVSWALLVVGVRLAMESAEHRFPRLRPWLAIAWAGAVVLGVLDVSFEMVRAIRTIPL